MRTSPALLSALLLAKIVIAMPVQAGCDHPGLPWIRVEVYAPMVRSDEPVEWIEINEQACVTARYAAEQIRAGIYQRQLAGSDHQQLLMQTQSKQLRSLDQQELTAAISVIDQQRAKSAGARSASFLVSDPGMVRIDVFRAGKLVHSAALQAPLQMAEAYPELSLLTDWAALIQSVREIADQADKQKIGTVQP